MRLLASARISLSCVFCKKTLPLRCLPMMAFTHRGLVPVLMKTQSPIKHQLMRCLATMNVPDVSKITSDIITETRRTDVMVDSLPLDHVTKLVSGVLEYEFSVSEARSLFTGRVWLMKQEEPLLHLLSILKLNGLSPRVMLGLVECIPWDDQESALKDFSGKVEYSIAILRGMGFTDRALRKLAEKSPKIFILDLEECEENWMKIQNLCSVADARSVVERCPNVLTDPWEKTYEKYEYAHYNMGYDEHQIVDSRIFSHSLKHIQDRHLFLSRAGLFAHVRLKDDPRMNPNPRLSNVVDVGARELTASLGCLSYDQYKTFVRLRKVERKLKRAEEMEDDDDEDEDESENEDSDDEDSSSESESDSDIEDSESGNDLDRNTDDWLDSEGDSHENKRNYEINTTMTKKR